MLFLRGVRYPEVNLKISFDHRQILGREDSEVLGIEFFSDIPLTSFSVSILLIYDPRMVLFQKKFRYSEGATSSFRFSDDFLTNPFLMLIDSFNSSLRRIGGRVKYDLRNDEELYDGEI